MRWLQFLTLLLRLSLLTVPQITNASLIEQLIQQATTVQKAKNHPQAVAIWRNVILTHPRRSVIRAYPQKQNKIKSVYSGSQFERNTLVGAL